jgi:hypothetical protein
MAPEVNRILGLAQENQSLLLKMWNDYFSC